MYGASLSSRQNKYEKKTPLLIDSVFFSLVRTDYGCKWGKNDYLCHQANKTNKNQLNLK